MAFHAARARLDEANGTVVAVVSGGNVDPDRYREYLAAPIPIGRAEGPGVRSKAIGTSLVSATPRPNQRLARPDDTLVFPFGHPTTRSVAGASLLDPRLPVRSPHDRP